MRALIGANATAAAGAPLRADLSMRYAPQVAGATRSAVVFCARTLETELNASVDNPTLFADGTLCSNSGTTSGQELAQALDLLGTSVASLAIISEQRMGALLASERNGGLPAFLRGPSATNSGLMIAQYTAASLVAELRTRAVPASLQSLPTCNHREDHVSMSALAARHATWVVETTETVVAIELLLGCRAVDLAGRALAGELARLHSKVRAVVPAGDDDRVIGDDIAAIAQLLRDGALGA
jgi:histidine ammonia-lyase